MRSIGGPSRPFIRNAQNFMTMNLLRRFFRLWTFFAALGAITLSGWGADAAASTANNAGTDTAAPSTRDLSYQLSIRDQIQVTVFDEPDLSVSARIDGSGEVKVPLLGNLKLAGLTIRDAEDYIQKLYVKDRILRSPSVSIHILDYAVREVTVLGEVRSPGKLSFPAEVNSLDIVDVIAKAGGFTNLAKADKVRVTRKGENDQEINFIVNVESIYKGRGSKNDASQRVPIYPGDIIFVPQIIF